jgi:hypothetical protein
MSLRFERRSTGKAHHGSAAALLAQQGGLGRALFHPAKKIRGVWLEIQCPRCSMSYESAVPVAYMLLFGNFIGTNTSETRSARLGGRLAAREFHNQAVECISLTGVAKVPRTDEVDHLSLQIIRCGQKGA